jgi:hypothetical protein
MKTLAFIISICLLSLTGYSKDKPYNYYWSSNHQLSFFKKIRLNNGSIKVRLENGKKVEVPVTDVTTYRYHGKTYEKLPVFVDNKYDHKCAFMQFVSTRGGLRLFKYTTWENPQGNDGSNLDVVKVDHYTVYNGNQFWVSVDQRNYKTIMDFFGVRYK